MALMAIVFVGLMIVGVFYAARQEMQVGSNAILQARAATAVEYGLNTTVSGWDNSRNLSMADGDTMRLAFNTGDGSVDTVIITKLNRYTFLLVSEGRAGVGTRQEARRKAGLIMRLAFPTVAYGGALTAAGPVSVVAPALIHGQNDDPNWNSGGSACVFNGQDVPAVATPDVTIVTAASGTVKTGSGSAVTKNAMAGDTKTYNAFGTETWSGMSSGANVTVAAGSSKSPRPWPTPPSTGNCDITDGDNWGDVDHSTNHNCDDYFPVVYAQGDLTLTGGTGQGLLLVERNLYITGAFKWIGLILVHGYVKMTGANSDINGALLAGGTGTVDTLTKSSYTNGKIRKSTCATEIAARGGALAALAKHRSWADLY